MDLGVDISTIVGVAMAHMVGVFSELERKRIAERTESLRAIADSLNRDEVPTAQGGAKWHAATVRGISPAWAEPPPE